MFDSVQLSRRDALKLSAAGVVGYSMSGWLEALANESSTNPQRRRSCILLWMNGGPSQMDTFDLKPGHANGGPYREIQTNVPGIRISEHLPRIARHMDKMAIIRAMNTREGDHGRGTFYLRSGYLPQGSAAPQPRRQQLFDAIEASSSSEKKESGSLSFLQRILGCIGITSAPKIDPTAAPFGSVSQPP